MKQEPTSQGNSGSRDLDGKHYSLFKQRVKDNGRQQCQGIWRHHMWSYEHHRQAYSVVHLCLHLGYYHCRVYAVCSTT